MDPRGHARRRRAGRRVDSDADPGDARHRRSLHPRAGLAAPFASDLFASPDGRAAAWVVNERACAMSGPPARRRDRATAHVVRDRRRPGDRRLVFAGGRGRSCSVRPRGRSNRRGEIPNPTSDASGSRQELFAVRSAAARRAGSRRAADRSRHRPATASTSSAPARRASSRSRAAPATSGSLRCAADGGAAAVSGRGAARVRQPAARPLIVGVFDLAARAIRWSTRRRRGSAPPFTADGRHAACAADRREEPNPFVARREGDPWEIRVADVATGKAGSSFARRRVAAASSSRSVPRLGVRGGGTRRLSVERDAGRTSTPWRSPAASR